MPTMWKVWPGAFAMASLLACGPKPEPQTQSSAPVAVVQDADEAEPVQEAEAPPERSFFAGQEPLSKLGEELNDILQAAMRGEPVPSTRIAMRYKDEDESSLLWPEGKEAQASDLRFLALLLELEVVFEKTTQEGQNRKARIDFLRTEHGLRVTRLRLGTVSRVMPLPTWLEEAEEAVEQVLTAARTGTVSQMLAGEKESTLFGSKLFWKHAVGRLPDGDDIDDFEQEAASLGEIIGYEFDDLHIFARATDGCLYRFAFDLDSHDGKVVLDNHPIARVHVIEDE